MAEIHHFDHGWLTPTVSYVLSVLGSMLGLTCAIRLRSAQTRGERLWWLGLAAVAIGGTAIWSMHFVAMMGFKVVGTAIRYDIALTIASAVLAIVAVALGLLIATSGNGARNVRVVSGGVLAGLGVAGMHYTGMAAMQLNGDVSYSPGRVGLSVGIAVVAAAVALWLAVTVQRPLIIFVSALVMGIAVNGMHFTGMTAMSVSTEPSVGQLAGATAGSMIVPIGVAVVFGIIGLAYALLAAPTEEDRAAAAYLAARRGGLAAAEAAAAAAAVPQQRTGRPTQGGLRQAGRPQQPSSPQPSWQPPSQRRQPGQGQGQGQPGRAQGQGQGQPGQGQPGHGQAPGQGQAPGERPPSSLGSGSWTYRDRAGGR